MIRTHFMGESQTTPPTQCPNCGYIFDMAAAIDEDKAMPKEGDVSICINCGHLSIFDEYLDLRQPTGDEIKTLAGDERIVAAMKALHHVKRA